MFMHACEFRLHRISKPQAYHPVTVKASQAGNQTVTITGRLISAFQVFTTFSESLISHIENKETVQLKESITSYVPLDSQVLMDAGLIAGGDMTPEAALSKLSYVLAKKDITLDAKKKVGAYIQNWITM